MKPYISLLVGTCALCGTLRAQQATVASAIHLETTKIELPLEHPAQIVDKAKCDGAGNIYARVWSGDDSPTNHLPVQEVSPQGRLIRSFHATEVSANTDSARGIFISDTGDLFQAARMLDGVYIISFGKDGSVRSTIKLQVEPSLVDPWQLVVFKASGFLLSGLTGKDRRTPYTAVFDSTGKLINKIYEPEDEEARQKAESGDPKYSGSNVGNRFVGFGDVTIASDGNAYLLRGTSPALIYVISSGGQVLRKLHIDSGEPDSVPRNVQSYGGRLALGFVGSGSLVVVTDLSGKIVANYSIDRRKPDWPALACYDATGFTFATTYAEKGLYLLKANVP